MSKRHTAQWLSLLLIIALTSCTTIQQVSHSGFGAYETSLTKRQDGFAVTWYDTRHDFAEIYLRILNAHGKPTGPEIRLTNNKYKSYEPDIEAVENNLLIAWYDKKPSGEAQANLGLWDKDGNSLWMRPLSTNNSRNPVIHYDNNEIFAAWLEEDNGQIHVWSGWWNKDGKVIAPPQQLGAAGKRTWNLNAGIDQHGRGIVVFDALIDTRSDELYLAKVEKMKHELIRLTRDDGFPSKYPDLVLRAEHIALTWFDEQDGNREIYVATGTMSDINTNFEDKILRISQTPDDSIGAYISMNEDRYGLTWSDTIKDQFEVYFQSLDFNGKPVGKRQRLTYNPSSSLIPAIEPFSDGFGLTWNESKPDPKGIHGPDGRSEIMFSFVR